MAVCAIVTAMFAVRSLCTASCALADDASTQARPTPATRHNATDMIESSLMNGPLECGHGGTLAHVPAKWIPVRRREHAPLDNSSAFPALCMGSRGGRTWRFLAGFPSALVMWYLRAAKQDRAACRPDRPRKSAWRPV